MRYLVKVLSAILIAVSTTTVFATTNFVLADNNIKKYDEDQIHCLALNIYYETRAVSLADAIAVSDVVMNRINSTRYPNTVCEVVKQGNKHSNGAMKKHQCQFSWYCDGKSDTPKNYEAWERSRTVAWDIYVNGTYIGITEGSTHYHANYVSPAWSKQLQRITRVGSHIFYRKN